VLYRTEDKISYLVRKKKIVNEFVHMRVHTVVGGCGRAIWLRHLTPRSVSTYASLQHLPVFLKFPSKDIDIWAEEEK